MEACKVMKFSCRDHGIDNPSYFQGCGTSFTEYAECATGVGDNPREALEDALEQIAQRGGPEGQNIDIENLKQRILRDENKGREFPEKPSASANMLEANGYGDEFQSDELDDAEPDRDDFETDEAFMDAYSKWEDAYAEAEEKWEQEKESFFDNIEGNYYHYSILYTVFLHPDDE